MAPIITLPYPSIICYIDASKKAKEVALTPTSKATTYKKK